MGRTIIAENQEYIATIPELIYKLAAEAILLKAWILIGRAKLLGFVVVVLRGEYKFRRLSRKYYLQREKIKYKNKKV